MKPTCKAVLDRLKSADGGWVPGNALADAAGWRFSARIYELRQMGHVIERRSDPRSAVDQYRLVVPDEQLTLLEGVA
jgi:hypothetical protein